MNAFCNEHTASFFLPKRVNSFDALRVLVLRDWGLLAGKRMLWKVVEQVLQGGLEVGVSIDFSSSSGQRWVCTQRYSSDPLIMGERQEFQCNESVEAPCPPPCAPRPCLHRRVSRRSCSVRSLVYWAHLAQTELPAPYEPCCPASPFNCLSSL